MDAAASVNALPGAGRLPGGGALDAALRCTAAGRRRRGLVQLGASHGLVQLGRRMPERRETCSCASRRGRVAAQKQWTSFFAYFPVLSPTHARAVVPRQPGAGHPQSFPS